MRLFDGLMTRFFTPILVSGPDARPFLQGQLTCDMDALMRERPLLACLNSPQGRVQAVCTVMAKDNDVLIWVVSPIAARTIERLHKYVLRSKAAIVEAGAEVADMSPPHADLLSNIRAGIPHVFPETHEAFVAQMLNLDALGAISFDKGCYTGQEIIARTHYRGAIKRRMFRFAANCAPPPPATRVLCNGDHAGDVVYAAATDEGCELLAVINLAQADEALTLDIQNSPALRKLSLPYSIQASQHAHS